MQVSADLDDPLVVPDGPVGTRRILYAKRELGLSLPSGSAPAANYVNAVRTGNLLFIAGKAPLPENGKLPKGKGSERVL